MAAQLLRMLPKLGIVLLDLTHQRKKRMIVLLFIQFLRKERHNIYIWFFFNLNNNIVNLLSFARAESYFDRFKGNQ